MLCYLSPVAEYQHAHEKSEFNASGYQDNAVKKSVVLSYPSRAMDSSNTKQASRVSSSAGKHVGMNGFQCRFLFATPTEYFLSTFPAEPPNKYYLL